MTPRCRRQSHVRPVLLWAALDALHVRLSPWSSAREPPRQRCNLTHDEAFDIDAALQLKLMLGIPAQLRPAGSTSSCHTDGLWAQSAEKWPRVWTRG